MSFQVQIQNSPFGHGKLLDIIYEGFKHGCIMGGRINSMLLSFLILYGQVLDEVIDFGDPCLTEFGYLLQFYCIKSTPDRAQVFTADADGEDHTGGSQQNKQQNNGTILFDDLFSNILFGCQQDNTPFLLLVGGMAAYRRTLLSSPK